MNNDEIKIGDYVEVIDPYDMNFKSKGKISKRETEYDIVYEGIEFKMVKVDFGRFTTFMGKEVYMPFEVPYAMHQLKKIKEKNA